MEGEGFFFSNTTAGRTVTPEDTRRQVATQGPGEDLGFDEEQGPTIYTLQEEQAADMMMLNTLRALLAYLSCYGCACLVRLPKFPATPDPLPRLARVRRGLALLSGFWAQKNGV